MKTKLLTTALIFSTGIIIFCSCDNNKSDDKNESGLTVNITNPPDGSQYTVVQSVDLSGTATDIEDGSLSGNSLTWESNIDGQIGIGKEVSTFLSPGTHTITLTAKDSDENKESASITVIVETPAFGSCSYDLTGTWNFTTSNATHSGYCPAGNNSSGTCVISQTGNMLTLTFMSGWTCDPVSMCTYVGACTGDVYTFSNSDDVDDEGGVATNAIYLTATSENTLSGSSASMYVIDNFTCTWGYDAVFTKAE